MRPLANPGQAALSCQLWRSRPGLAPQVFAEILVEGIEDVVGRDTAGA